MVKQQAKLMLRAFNGESDAAIAKVKYDNVATLEERIGKAHAAINKMGEVQRVFIASQYFDLKLAELRLVHEHREKVQEEKEEQRRVKDQMREEQKAQEEIEKAKAEAEKEEAVSAAALEKARAELAAASGKQHEKFEALVTRLENELKDALDRKAKAIARAQLTKSGHVYVLSNIGSFGEGIYKIGMTRRLEPLERIDELGDASVPFRFDVHAIIYSEDAPSLENKIHKAFADRRVNIVNMRKEPERCKPQTMRTTWVAQGRVYVVHFDGRSEILTVLDAAGQVLASGSNEKAFAFNGYDPDYIGGLKKVQTQMEVGDGQTVYLDTALHDGTKVSCITPDGGQYYPTGFAVCGNDLLLQGPGVFDQPLVAPRSDDDYTNPAKAPPPPNVAVDPLGPQLLLLNQQYGVGAIHGTLNDVTVRPLEPGSSGWDQYLRINTPAERPVGPVHHAELQAFHNAGKLQKFYALFDSRFEVLFQDRFRTSIFTHWRPKFTGDDPLVGVDFNAAKSGRFAIKFADMRPVVNFDAFDYALDSTSDGSLFAHEYHHHIQESLAKDNAWDLLPNPVGELFPGTCPSETLPCNRRIVVLEGVADGFAALEVRRAVITPLMNSTEPLSQLLGVCDNKSAYGTGILNNSGLPNLDTRYLCNKRAFGYWEEAEPGGGDTDACTWPSVDAKRFDSDRRLVIGGAMFGYERRFFDSGLGSAIPGRHLIEAERALKGTTDGEVKYFGALLKYLRASAFADGRRWEYTARAAFLEKGIFPPEIHFLAAIGSGDVDKRPIVRCNTSECSDSIALARSALTLTMSGAFDWSSTTQAPEFDLYAVPGTRYTTSTGPGNPNQVWLELSDNAAFSSTAGTATSDPQTFSPTTRLNCSPRGFFRAKPLAASWAKVATAALADGDRVYYRVRQCLASASGPNDPANCVVSTTATTPAYVRIHFEAGGCPSQCGVVGAESERESWPWLALLPLAAGLSRRLVRKRRAR